MITEDYVSFETAKLLKEKGFDEKCMSYYGHGEFHLGNREYMKSNTDRDGVAFNGVPYDAYNAPTLQMAMKWLREVYGISIEPFVDYGVGDESWWSVHVDKIKNGIIDSLTAYVSYEQACEAAIKYCLENLI